MWVPWLASFRGHSGELRPRRVLEASHSVMGSSGDRVWDIWGRVWGCVGCATSRGPDPHSAPGNLARGPQLGLGKACQCLLSTGSHFPLLEMVLLASSSPYCQTLAAHIPEQHPRTPDMSPRAPADFEASHQASILWGQSQGSLGQGQGSLGAEPMFSRA